MRALTLSVLIAAIGTEPALAHVGHDHGSGAVGWTFDPWILVPIILAGLSFCIGTRRLHKRAQHQHGMLRRRTYYFAVGLLILCLSLVSPLHEAGERSFTAHMIEHELLMLVAAPLLVLSHPAPIMLWALPAPARRIAGKMFTASPVRGAWRTLSAPVTATLIQAAALWIWHAPALFDRALASDGWHIAQHLSFLISALLFWSAMLGRKGARSSDSATIAIAALCLFATSVISGALGAFMAFSRSPWYSGYAKLGMAPFGLSAAEDQQLAGLIMWVPGGLVHAVVALLLVRELLQTPTRGVSGA